MKMLEPKAELKGKYRLLLLGYLLILIFFTGIGQVSLNRDGGSSDSLKQPAFGFTIPALGGLSFSVGGKLENLVLPLLLLWGLGMIRDRELRLKMTPLLPPLLVFLFLSVLAYLFSPFRDASWRGGLREILLGGGFYFAAAAIISSERYRKAALGVLYLSVGISVAAGLSLYSRGIYFPHTPRRIWLSFMHPNTTGSALLLLIPVGVALAAGKISRRGRVLAGALTVFLTLALVLTFSRTAWLGFIVALGVLAMQCRHRFRLLGGLILLVSLLILGVCVGPRSYLRDRILSFSSLSRDHNIEKRLIYWQGVGRMIQTRPVLGYGPGSGVFQEAYKRRFKEVETNEEPVHAHSLYLDLASGIGIPGLLAFLWLVGAAFVSLRSGMVRNSGTLECFYNRGLTAGLAGFLFAGLADNPLFSFRVMLIFWLLLALVPAGEERVLKLVKDRKLR